MDSQVFILDELNALNVHYFPTYFVLNWHILGRFSITIENINERLKTKKISRKKFAKTFEYSQLRVRKAEPVKRSKTRISIFQAATSHVRFQNENTLERRLLGLLGGVSQESEEVFRKSNGKQTGPYLVSCVSIIFIYFFLSKKGWKQLKPKIKYFSTKKKKIPSDIPKCSFSDFETEPETAFGNGKFFFLKI